MKTKSLLSLLSLIFLFLSCSNNIEFSEEFKKNTSGNYLYNADEMIEVYYVGNNLYLKWKGAEKIEPVITGENEFFVADMYNKLKFVQHPETKKRYLSIISKETPDVTTYDYLKVPDGYKTPAMHLKDKEYQKAFEGYLAIKKKDSTSILINEREFNQLGYELLRKKQYDKAIDVFKMNVALYPESDNVYDSLGDAYLRTGDSINAYTNYKKAFKLYNGNKKAKQFIEAYEKKHD